MSDLPTARDYLKSNVRLLIWCKACRHQREIEFASLVAQDKGDIAMVRLNSAVQIVAPARPIA